MTSLPAARQLAQGELVSGVDGDAGEVEVRLHMHVEELQAQRRAAGAGTLPHGSFGQLGQDIEELASGDAGLRQTSSHPVFTSTRWPSGFSAANATGDARFSRPAKPESTTIASANR